MLSQGKSIRRIGQVLIFATTWLLAVEFAHAASTIVRGELKTWHPVILDIYGPDVTETAPTFRNYRLDVTFRNQATGDVYRVPGFFAADGNAGNTRATSGNVWRAYFNPPSTGTWTCSISFRQGADVAANLTATAGSPVTGVDGITGSLSVAPTDKTGDDFRAKGMLRYAGGYYLRHAGTGHYFIKAGAGSPENFLAYSDFDGTVRTHSFAPHVQDRRAGDPTWGADWARG